MTKVLFVASECAPLAKVGGLGDVIGSLPKALSKIGVDARVIIPFYEEIDRKKWKPRLVISNLVIGNWEGKEEKIDIYKTRLPRSSRNDKAVEVFLVYNKKYLSAGPIYFEKTAFVGSKKEIDRFVFFSKAVYELLKHPKFFKPDIIHCNDWHSAALISMIQSKNFRTVFTVHNLANQGKWGGRNLMAEGIKNADKITTVSQTYAKEILTKEYGEGLEKKLRKRKKDLIGILNGIDYDEWK